MLDHTRQLQKLIDDVNQNQMFVNQVNSDKLKPEEIEPLQVANLTEDCASNSVEFV